MQAMKDFTFWLLNQLPTFLMSEPIIYFIGTLIMIWLVTIILKIFNMKY